MSKKVAILEGDKSRRFGGVKYLRTDLSGGGTCEWVPESERKLTTKTVKKNGTYKISDEKPDKDGQKYYGFSQFTVNVKNSTTGRKNPSTGGDGNEYSVKPNEDTGMLEETVLPSSIKVVGNPTKTQYNDGEAINKAGMVVKAYLADGTLYDYSGYQAGAIPLSELTLDPTTASGGSQQDTYTDGDGIVANLYTVSDSQTRVGVWGYFYMGSVIGQQIGGQYDGMDVALSASDVPSAKFYLTQYEGKLYVRRADTNSPNCNFIMIDNGTPYINSSIGTLYNDEWRGYSAHGTWNVPVSTKDPEMAGELVPIGESTQQITVKWNRPEDEKELTDTFNITVN